MPGDIWLSNLGGLTVHRAAPTTKNYPASSDSLVAQMVKHLPAVRETRVRSLGREDPPKKEMATHSSTLA